MIPSGLEQWPRRVNFLINFAPTRLCARSGASNFPVIRRGLPKLRAPRHFPRKSVLGLPLKNRFLLVDDRRKGDALRKNEEEFLFVHHHSFGAVKKHDDVRADRTIAIVYRGKC